MTDLAEIVQSFGERRRLLVAFLAEHPELDGPTWEGQEVAHFGRNGSVKAAIQPHPTELGAKARNAA